MTVTISTTPNQITVSTGVTAEYAKSLIATKQGTFFSTAPTNDTITLIAYALYAFTINQIFSLVTASGTIDVTIQINGTDVTGLTSLSASSSSQNPTATAANTVAVGDKITLVLANNIAATDLEFTLKGTQL